MSVVPTENESVNQTVAGGGGLPMVATPGNMGAGIGEALEQGAEVATKIHHDAVSEFNQTMALDAHNQLQQFGQEQLFDPKTGLLNQNTGKDAPQAVDKTMSAYDQKVSDISGSMPEGEARNQFARLAQDNRFQVQQHLNGYESRQINQYHEQVTSATLKNAATSAVNNTNAALADPSNNPTDPGVRQQIVTSASNDSIAMGVAVLKDEGKRKGQPQETTDEQVAEFTSATRYGVIQSLNSQGQDQDAKAYYNAWKGDLRGEQADHAARQVQAGSTAGDATRLAPTLVFNKDGSMRDLGDIWGSVNGNKQLQGDPKLMEATEGQVRRLISQQDEIKRAHQEDTFKDAYDLMNASPQGFSDPAVQAKIQSLTPERQKWLQSADTTAQKLAAKQAQVPDGSSAFYNLLSNAYSDEVNPQTGHTYADDFRDGDLLQVKGQVSDKDWNHAMELQMQRRGKAQKDDSQPDQAMGLRSPLETAHDAFSSAGFKVKDAQGNSTKDYNDFMGQVDAQVAAYGGAKKIGEAGVQKVIDAQLLKTSVTTSHWFGADTQEPGPARFQVLPRDFAYTPATLTPAQRQQALGKLRNQGVANPTQDELYQTYLGTVPNAPAYRPSR